MYTLLYTFSGGADGGYPFGSLIVDANGTVYGTTYGGGAYGYGVVFELTQESARDPSTTNTTECAGDH